MNRTPPVPVVLVLALFLGAAGCRRAPEGWTPVLEQTSTSHLESEIDRTLERVSAARDRIRSDPDQASELLAAAEGGLRSLRHTFLPVFRAKSLAYNAYRYHYLGRDDDAASALEGVEELLLDVANGADGSLLAELEQLEDRVVEARVEVEAGSAGATAALRELAETLETFVARADLFI